MNVFKEYLAVLSHGVYDLLQSYAVGWNYFPAPNSDRIVKGEGWGNPEESIRAVSLSVLRTALLFASYGYIGIIFSDEFGRVDLELG